jgi:hypothetical protein
MSAVSRGHALLWSAALHTLGLGVAGWTTHGQSHEPTLPELQVTRAFALHFLIPAAPRSRTSAQALPRTPSPRPAVPTPPGAAPRVLLSTAPETSAPADPDTEPPRSSLQAQELLPGSTVTSLATVGAALEAKTAPAFRRGVDRAAALAAPAGSACPELPPLPVGSQVDLSVAVSLVVDASGKVDPAALRVVESPGRPVSDRRFYPRIYVVALKGDKVGPRIEPAAYDSVVTQVVTSHMAALTFHPAMRQGRPVSSTVLIACHQVQS